MPDESRGIIGGIDGKKASQVFAGTRALFQGSAAPAQQQRNTGVECPLCKADGILQNPVLSDGSELRCNVGHRFADTDDLMSRPHGNVPVAMPTAPQENYVALQIQLPARVVQGLQAKYSGDVAKMKATLAALATHMLEPNTMILPESELRRIGDKAGQPIRNPAELYGVIAGQQQQIDDLKEAAKGQPEASQQSGAGSVGLRRGEVILWFDPPTTALLAEQAQANSVRLEVYLETFIAQAKENNWF